MIRGEPGAGQYGPPDIQGAGKDVCARAFIIGVRVGPDERHPDQAFIMIAMFQHQPMVTHHVAVVGIEDDHGVFGKTQSLQLG